MADQRSPFLANLPEGELPAELEANSAERRRRMAAHLQSKSRQFKQAEITRIRTRRAGSLVLAAAASAALWFGVAGMTQKTPADGALAQRGDHIEQPSGASKNPGEGPLGQESGTVETARAQPLEASADAGYLTVGSSDPARLEVGATAHADPGSRFRLSLQRQPNLTAENVDLRQGKVSLTVPKLSTNQSLTVTTAEAVVEVRGTAFSVSRTSSDQGFITRVHVTEGLVAVRPVSGRELLLGSGESWTSSSSRDASASAPVGDNKALSVRAIAKPTVPPESSEHEVDGDNSVGEDTFPDSVLPEQIRVYQSALYAKRNGMTAAARTRFEEFLTRFPNSPLANSARRELQRLDEEEQVAE